MEIDRLIDELVGLFALGQAGKHANPFADDLARKHPELVSDDVLDTLRARQERANATGLTGAAAQLGSVIGWLERALGRTGAGPAPGVAAPVVSTRRHEVPIDVWAVFAQATELAQQGQRLGDPKLLRQAIARFDACLQVWTRAGDLDAWAGAQMHRANSFSILGEQFLDLELLHKAIAGYAACLNVRTLARDPGGWVRAQSARANALMVLDERLRDENILREAIARYSLCLAVWPRDRNSAEWAADQASRANALQRLGERLGDPDLLGQAIAGYQACLEVQIKAGDLEAGWATAMGNFANALQALGKRIGDLGLLRQAIAAYDSCLDVVTREHKPTTWAHSQLNRASALLSIGSRLGDSEQLRQAIAGYDACLKVWTRVGAPFNWAVAQMNRANALKTLGKRIGDLGLLRQAIAGYDGCLEVWTHAGAPFKWATAQSNRALSLQCLGEFLGDPEQLRQAIAAHEAALGVLQPESDISVYIAVSRNLSTALELIGDHARQRALLDAVLDLFPKLSVRPDLGAPALAEAAAGLSGLADRRAQVGRALGETAADLLYHVERGRARLLALALAGDPLDRAVLSAEETAALARIDHEIAETKGMVDRHDSFGPGRPLAARPGGTTAPVDSEAPARFAAALAARRAFLADRGLLPKPPDRNYDELCKALPSDGAIVTLSLTDKAGLLLILSRCAGRTELEALPLDEVSEGVGYAGFTEERPDGTSLWDAIWDFRNNAGERDLEKRARFHALFRAALERHLGTIWDRLLATTDARLHETGLPAGAPVTLVVPGLVAAMPLHAAALAPADGQPPKTFGDRWTVSLSPSIEPLLAATQRRAATDTAHPLTALCIADPANSGQDPLPGAAAEAAVLRSVCPERTEVLAGAEANVEAVIEGLPRAGIAHFACHGWFDPLRPQQSGVLLADGDVLTFERLLRIAPRLGRLRLVVLSACDSGVSGVQRAPDEFVGLPSAWLHLGAEAVLASHWPVDDVVTALTMRRFYDAFLDEHGVERQPPAAALREATHWLRSVTNAELRETFGADSIAVTMDGELVLDLAPALTRRIEAVLGAARAPLPDPAAVAALKASHEAHMHETARLRKRLLIPFSGSENHRPFADPLHWAAFSVTGR